MSATDGDGRTPGQVAQSKGKAKLVELLSEADGNAAR